MTTPVPELFDVSGLVVVITGGGTGTTTNYERQDKDDNVRTIRDDTHALGP